MNIKINAKNLNVKLNSEEITLINTIIDKIDFDTLRKITNKTFSENKLVEILKSLYSKQVIYIDTPELLDAESFERGSSVYMYSDTDLNDKINGLYRKIKEGKNYYEIFGVTPDASIQDIKFVYFKFSKKYHPDIIKKHNLPPEIKEKVDFVMLEISNIFNILKSPDKRKEYDKTLNIFKKRLTNIKKNDASMVNSDKSTEYYKLALNEYNAHNYIKAKQLISLSLSYNPKNQKALKLKSDNELMLKKDRTMKLLKEVDSYILKGEYYYAFEKINDLIIEYGDDKKFLIKKVKILERMDFERNKNKIINLLEDVVRKEPDDIQTRELLIDYLKLYNEKKKLKEEAEKLLKIDPKNKIAKKYTKGKLWNIF